jgi:hypothetical protein
LTRITWDAVGARKFETGIDRGVLYVGAQPGVAWNGLTSVAENAQGAGGTTKTFYVDGEKYMNLASREEYQATLTAYTYPEEFEQCNGVVAARTGLFVTKQKRIPFGLTYRTMIGNDVSTAYGYKIHLVYDVLASPANKSYKTMGDKLQLDDFSWVLTTTPSVMPGYRRTSHLVIDSTIIEPSVLSGIEDILYGNATFSPRLPALAELTDLIDTGNTLVVVDNGDGTYTMTAPLGDLTMLDTQVWQLNWPTVAFIDANTYTVGP